MKVGRKFAMSMTAASLLMAVSFAATGPVVAAPKPLPTLRVTCLDWYQDAGGNHWHVEAHVKDAAGNGVVGADVQFQNWVAPADGTTPYVYQTDNSATSNWIGVNKGAGCGTNASTTVTGNVCVPKALQAPDGLYYTKILSVTKTGYVWDGVTPSNGFNRVAPK